MDPNNKMHCLKIHPDRTIILRQWTRLAVVTEYHVAGGMMDR